MIQKRKREKRKRDLINHFRVHKFATYPSNGTGRIGLILELTLITLKSYSFVLFTVELDSNTVEPLVRTPKGQSEVSVLERCPYKRGHYDNVAFITPLTVLRVQLLEPVSPSSLNRI